MFAVEVYFEFRKLAEGKINRRWAYVQVDVANDIDITAKVQDRLYNSLVFRHWNYLLQAASVFYMADDTIIYLKDRQHGMRSIAMTHEIEKTLTLAKLSAVAL